ncbi:BsuPI-related putative proteinase inhibitor [Candidatus Palauibacter polyketidifaciens]|uniref:BsuPI-related putative proteinase inhibitor n=1 Tax=Candidatus Palauibacter polyketidifaciens TaxID=3056740 RepID=UPI00239F25C8|nr:BsuPI-related putative proteinase inhibitor [Candidatus Palauibacter polyketidifaciens]MDE2720830.1 BsuPI-related putative proteinase inhibitor [Candidatus Palauibacter polyketidifaciens]
MAPAVLPLALAAFACASGSAEGPAAGESGRELRLSLSTGEASPEAATPVVLELTGTNDGPATLILDFPDGQRYDFEVISEDGAVVWHWAEGRFFAQVLGRETLEPGASLRWTGRIEAGLPAGVYRVIATLTTVEPHAIEATLTVLPRS